jgi:hypothetical protein
VFESIIVFIIAHFSAYPVHLIWKTFREIYLLFIFTWLARIILTASMWHFGKGQWAVLIHFHNYEFVQTPASALTSVEWKNYASPNKNLANRGKQFGKKPLGYCAVLGVYPRLKVCQNWTYDLKLCRKENGIVLVQWQDLVYPLSQAGNDVWKNKLASHIQKLRTARKKYTDLPTEDTTSASTPVKCCCDFGSR